VAWLDTLARFMLAAWKKLQIMPINYKTSRSINLPCNLIENDTWGIVIMSVLASRIKLQGRITQFVFNTECNDSRAYYFLNLEIKRNVHLVDIIHAYILCHGQCHTRSCYRKHVRLHPPNEEHVTGQLVM
jgi:hypothetical protein